jgi:RNA polymerase sigma-70 factor (ECF subfamily)
VSDIPAGSITAVPSGRQREWFDALFLARYAELCTQAERMVGDRAAAEDCVQDVLLSVWRRRDELFSAAGTEGLPDLDSLDSYLRVAVRNRARQHLARALVASRHAREITAAATAPHVPPPTAASADAPLLHDDLRQTLTAAVRALPAQQRAVFLLRRFGELSTAEVAHTLGVSVKTVENHLGRALRTLTERLRRMR